MATIACSMPASVYSRVARKRKFSTLSLRSAVENGSIFCGQTSPLAELTFCLSDASQKCEGNHDQQNAKGTKCWFPPCSLCSASDNKNGLVIKMAKQTRSACSVSLRKSTFVCFSGDFSMFCVKICEIVQQKSCSKTPISNAVFRRNSTFLGVQQCSSRR